MTNLGRWLLVVVGFLVGGCAPWPLQVTSELSGKVIDAATQRPIVGAKVYLSEFPEKAVSSSAKGEFVIAPIRKWQVAVLGTDLRPGYSLVVEAKGYRSVQRNWSVGNDRLQVIELRVSGEK